MKGKNFCQLEMKKDFFKNKKVTVMGLGLIGGGAGTVKFLVKKGAQVLVTDLKTKKELKESLKKIKGLPVKLVLGKHRPQDFIYTDLIIKNPGVPDNSPYLEIARKNSVLIETDVGIFFELCKAPIIGVTGTKGKSTVVSLLYHLLRKKYPKVILAGNIGTSPLQSLKKITKESKVVLELSSWQLEGLKSHKKSPKIAIITNIYRDHLNRYKSFRSYINSKKIIFQFQKPNDILLLNYDNAILRKFYQLAISRVYSFSQKKLSKKLSAVCFLKDKKIFFGKEVRPICSLKELKIQGEHNISNALAAISAAKLCKVPSKVIKETLKKFKGIALRQEFIQEIKGVKYFNDTTATIPQATQAAIETLEQKFPEAKIILIAGGEDKNISYENLAKEIKKKVNYLILLSGSASDKIKKELFAIGDLSKKRLKLPIFTTNSMERAVEKAKRLAKNGDIVILSPGAASFNLFENEFDRGRQFNVAVKKLKHERSFY